MRGTKFLSGFTIHCFTGNVQAGNFRAMSCPPQRGCYSQGETYEEAVENMKDAECPVLAIFWLGRGNYRPLMAGAITFTCGTVPMRSAGGAANKS